MYLNLKKTLLATTLALIAFGVGSAPTAMAENTAVAAQKAPAKKKAKAEPKEEEASAPSEADDGDTITTDYRCELGNTLTIFQHEGDDTHIALRWKKRIHRLERVGTTTGALRFQNTSYGLIWIGIPSKGMLLDAKLNRQLANECKNAEQEKIELAAKEAEKPADSAASAAHDKAVAAGSGDKQPKRNRLAAPPKSKQKAESN